MAASAGTVTLDLDANSVKLIRELNKAQKKTKRTASRMRKDMQRSFAAMGKAAAGFGVVLAAATKASVDYADKIAKTSDKIGVNVEALQELRFAAKRAGVEQNTLDMALQRFTRRAGEAAIGTGEAKAAIAEMGIELRDASGNIRSTNDLLRDVADAFQKTTDPATRLRLAFKLFDSEGAALVNMLSDGADGLNKVTQEARDLGVVMKESLVRDAEKAADKMGDLQKVLQVRIASTVLENTDAIISLTDAILSLVIAAGKAMGSVPPFMEWLGESVAASIHGPALDDFIRREDEITKLQEKLNSARDKSTNFLGMENSLYTARATSLEREIALKKESLRVDREAFQSALTPKPKTTPAGTPAGIAPPVIDPGQTADNAAKVAQIVADMMANVKTFGMTDDQKALINLIDLGATEEMQKEFVKATEAMRHLIEQEEIANAVLEEVVVTARKIPVVVQESAEEMDQFAIQAARNLQTAFADFLFDPFAEGLGGMLKGFADTLRRMVAEALAAQLLKSMFGGLSGSGNSFFASLGAAFGGGRAMGGPIAAGTPYLVGERGPELIVPRNSGTVIPNNQMGGGITNIVNLPPTTQRQTPHQVAHEVSRIQKRATSRNQ